MLNCTIIVPCYNEQARLDRKAVLNHLARSPEQFMLFVNDGSIDGTLDMLDNLRSEMPAQIGVLHLARNSGKGEAVRTGLLRALGSEAEYVGYWDADLATPLSAIDDLLSILRDRCEVDVVLGSRVQLLGRTIERQIHRHYLGRAFATCASFVLDVPIYDTQCGAKLFRATPALQLALAEPFLSRWIFDVELLARLLTLSEGSKDHMRHRIYEFPLNYWRDIPGSKLRSRDFLRAAGELANILKTYRRGICQHKGVAGAGHLEGAAEGPERPSARRAS